MGRPTLPPRFPRPRGDEPYWPTGGQDHATLRAIKTHLPEGGQVRVLALTDRQWATGLRFDNAKPRKESGAPEQLMIF